MIYYIDNLFIYLARRRTEALSLEKTYKNHFDMPLDSGSQSFQCYGFF